MEDKTELKPSVKEMLVIGEGSGLTYVSEAYSSYLNHYDCFFLISKFKEQLAEFHQEMQSIGLVVSKEGKLQLIDDLTIIRALQLLEERKNVDRN
jgi:hypothetical protein